MRAPGSTGAYLGAFGEDAGYLNFASYGPPSRAVADVTAALLADAIAGAPGASARLHAEDLRARAAFARLTGFTVDSVVSVPSTSAGLFQVAFGMPRGTVLVSSGEFPANLYPWRRAEEAGLLRVRVMGGAGVAVTASVVADALAGTPDVVVVTVSAVDFRTGAVADLEGILSVIGDRLLVVDGVQAFGVVELPWQCADALVVGGQKWVRAGWGTGAMAFSPRGLARVRPVLGGWTGVERITDYDGQVHPLLPDAARFGVTNLSPFAAGAFATALELIESVGVATIAAAIATRVDQLTAILAAAGVEVLAPPTPAAPPAPAPAGAEVAATPPSAASTAVTDGAAISPAGAATSAVATSSAAVVGSATGATPAGARVRSGIVVAAVCEHRGPQVLDALAAHDITATLHGDDRLRFGLHATTRPDRFDDIARLLRT